MNANTTPPPADGSGQNRSVSEPAQLLRSPFAPGPEVREVGAAPPEDQEPSGLETLIERFRPGGAANLLLGWALAIAPSAAWIGVRGSLSWEPVLLSVAVASWAGSFDILYHVQDVDFYTGHGLHSVARRFGVNGAFRWALLLDIAALGSLMALGIWTDLAWPYYLGLVVAAVLLVYKRRLLSPDDTSRIGMTFFRINAYVSTSVFLATLVAVLV